VWIPRDEDGSNLDFAFTADVGRFPLRTDHFTRRLTDGNTQGGMVTTGDPAMNVTYRRT